MKLIKIFLQFLVLSVALMVNMLPAKYFSAATVYAKIITINNFQVKRDAGGGTLTGKTIKNNLPGSVKKKNMRAQRAANISRVVSELSKMRVADFSEKSVIALPETENIVPVVLSNKKISGRNQNIPRLPKSVASRSIVMNFDKADIMEVLSMVAGILKLDYIIEPGVAGKITIHTTGKITGKELFSVLRQIFSTNGLAIIREGRYFRVTKLADASRKPVDTFLGNDGGAIPSDDTVIIQLVPLKYIPSKALEAVLLPLLTKTGKFLKIPNSNLLGIIDTGINIRRLLDIISIVDTDVFGKMKIKLFPVRFGKADELNNELSEILESVNLMDQKNLLKTVPIPRLNSILAVAANSEYLKTIEEWIKKLDLPDVSSESMSTYIYRVQNGDAANIASLIQQIYRPSASGKTKRKTKQSGKAVKSSGKTGTRVLTTGRGAGNVQILPGRDIEGELNVVSDAFTNTVIIRTNPLYYPIINETIKKLDVAPMQVMVEMMVAELTLDQSTRFGLEWAVRGGSAGYSVDSGSGIPGKLGDSFTSPGGVASYFIQDTGSILGLISLKASESKLNVLSSPVILTSENKEASISITNSVPISSTTTSSSGITTSSFEYTDAGIILKVTPKINTERFVSMDIYLEVSQVGEKPPQNTANTPPPIFKRVVQTSFVVKDRETLVIGGLIDSAKRSNTNSVPGLSKIPVIGALFRNWTKSESKTELIILITPRVIDNVSESKKITDSFKKRIEGLHYRINQKSDVSF